MSDFIIAASVTAFVLWMSLWCEGYVPPCAHNWDETLAAWAWFRCRVLRMNGREWPRRIR